MRGGGFAISITSMAMVAELDENLTHEIKCCGWNKFKSDFKQRYERLDSTNSGHVW